MSAGTASAPNPTTTSRTCVQVSARISTPHAPCAATCANRLWQIKHRVSERLQRVARCGVFACVRPHAERGSRTAWGSPSLPNAHAAAREHSHSAAAARTFSLSPSAFMSAGTAWGSPSRAQRLRCRTANILTPIPQCLDERGHGRSAYLHQRLRCRTANSIPIAISPVLG
jgi:hypothetical protein